MGAYPSGGERGRPPTPTAIRKLRGTVLNKNETRIVHNSIAMPRTLTLEAHEVWNEHAPELLAMGLLCPADSALFAEFCESVVAVRIAREQIYALRDGTLEVKAGGSSPFNAYARAVAVMSGLAGRFGMSPLDRTRIQVDKPTAEDDLISA